MSDKRTPSEPLFDLQGYLTDAIDDLILAAQACHAEAARGDLTDEVMRLFDASSELCRAMRRFAHDDLHRRPRDAGIGSQARLCSGDAPP